MAMNTAQLYQGNRVNTASPAELTLMLYDGAIKFCNIAIGALEKDDKQKANTNLIKAQKIIVEFRRTLDFKYPVAQQFDIVYDYIYRRLVEANIKKDKDIAVGGHSGADSCRNSRICSRQILHRQQETELYGEICALCPSGHDCSPGDGFALCRSRNNPSQKRGKGIRKNGCGGGHEAWKICRGTVFNQHIRGKNAGLWLADPAEHDPLGNIALEGKDRPEDRLADDGGFGRGRGCIE